MDIDEMDKMEKRQHKLTGKWLKIYKAHKKEMGGFCICGLAHELQIRQFKAREEVRLKAQSLGQRMGA